MFGTFTKCVTAAASLLLAEGALAQEDRPNLLGPRATSAASDLFPLPPIDEPAALTLAEAEQRALRQNPALGRAAAALAAAQGDWLQAGLWPDPSVSVGEAQLGSDGLAEQDFAGVSQTIVTGRKLELNRSVAASAALRKELEYDAVRNQVLTDVRIAFFDALIARGEREAAERLVQIARDGVAMARRAEKSNDTGQNDVLEAQIEQYSAEIVQRTRENRVVAADAALAAIVGGQLPPGMRLAGRFDLLPPERRWPDSLDRLMQISPELAANLADQNQARWALERAQAERIPDVTVDAFVNWRDNGIGGDPDGALMVTLPLPVWNRNRGNIASAAADVAAAAHSAGARRLELQLRLANALERLGNYRHQAVEYRDRILPAAQTALALTAKSFEAGDVDYDDVITSQRTNVTATMNYLDALRQFWAAEFEIEGMLLTGSLWSR